MSLKKLASLIIKINANGAQAQAELKTLEKKVNDFGKSMKRVGQNMTKYVTVPLAALATASVTASNTQLQAEAKLLTALKGREDVQRRLMKQASMTQSRTLFGDETIIEQQAYLAALGLSEQQINDTIEAAVQLSVALGMDLTSAVKNLAKTYGGMTGELGESIPALKNFTKEQLKAGDAIGYVNANYEGFAESAAEAGTGFLPRLQNKLGDIAEKIGTVLIPVLEKVAVVLEKFVDWLNQLPQPVQNTIIWIGTAVAAIGPLITIIGSLISKLGALALAIPKVGAALVTLAKHPVAIIIAALGALLIMFDTCKSKAERALEAAKMLEEYREAGRVENDDYFYNLTMDMYNRPSISDEKLQELKNEYQSWIDAETNSNSKRNLQAQLRAINDIILQRMRAVEDGVALQRELNEETQVAVGIIGKLQEQIKALENKKLLATSEEEIRGINDELKNLTEELERIDNLKSPGEIVLEKIATPSTINWGDVEMKGDFALERDLLSQRNFEEWRNAQLERANRMVETVQELNGVVSRAVQNAAIGLGELVGNLITGEEVRPLQSFLEFLGKLLKELGAALITYAGLIEAFKKTFENPYAAIAVGIAAVAAGQVFINIAKKPMKKLAQGGLAYGPTMAVVGDNPGAKNDPEVIAPLSKLRNYMGGQKLELTGEIEWELRGDTLRAVLDRENLKLSRIG